MAECNTKINAEIKTFLKNSCLPAGFTSEIELTPYIESDQTGEFDIESLEGQKANSYYKEEYHSSFGMDYTYTAKLRTDTYIAQYFKIIAELLKTEDVSVMNTFTFAIETPYAKYTYPSCALFMTNIPLENIESKEWTFEFRIHPNGKPIITPNAAIETLLNPQNANLNLTVVENGADAFDLTFDTEYNSLNFENMEVIITQAFTPVTELISDGSAGTFTTSSSYDTSLLTEFELRAKEIGYSTYYTVGTVTFTPAP